jgi:hypothetical protein
MKKRISVMFFIVFVLFSEQCLSVDCPPTGGTWQTGFTSYDFGQYGPGGEVSYSYRVNSPFDIDVDIDWDTYVNNSDFVPDEALKRILEIEAIKAAALSAGAGWEHTKTINIYSTKKCYATLKLVLEYYHDFSAHCCDSEMDMAEKYYEYFDGTQWRYLSNEYSSVECGVKCCKKVYPVIISWDNIREVWRANPQDPTSYSVTNCGGDTDYIDCITGNPIPCNDPSCD